MSEEELILKIDREWNEAYPNRDIAALDRVIADDWVCIDGSGTVIGKEDLLDRVGSNPNAMDSHKFDEIELRMFGDDTAIVTGRLSGAGTNADGPFEFRQRYTRVYVRRNSVWQAISTQVTVSS